MNYYFITGTSTGIGHALVKELLLSENNIVYGFSRTNTLKHKRFHHKYIDLSNLEKVSEYVFPILEDAKKIVLINNAGTLGDIKHIGDLKAFDIISAFNVNITSVALLSNSFINQYQTNKNERIIINISSGAAQSAYDGWASYCASKSAINMLTLAIEKEQQLKKNPIKVFAIAPGVVDTYMQDLIRKSNKIDFNNINKFHSLKSSGALYLAKDVAKRIISHCENTETISEIISRIEI